MKRIFLYIVFFSFSIATLSAQENSNVLPLTTAIVPYKLEIGFNYNTAIAFPTTIKKAYWGYKEIMALNVPDVDNILLVKAAKKNFEPTNLHVITADGKLYVFTVAYADAPGRTTYDLRQLPQVTLSNFATGVSFTNTSMNEEELKKFMEGSKEAKPFLSRTSRRYEMQLQLKGIYFKDDLLFFTFDLSNLSNLDYNLDFMHFYIKDKHKSKHTSFQQREMIPVKVDSVSAIAGQSTARFSIVVPKFTIPDEKEFLFEVYEVNGGRNIRMKIKNRHLLKAKSF